MSARTCAFVLAAFALAGCEKHMQDMYDQPRYKPLAASPIFADGGAERPPVPGTQIYSRGEFAGTSSGRVGTAEASNWERDAGASQNPYPLTTELLERGRERYTIYCAPCHSPSGDGDGFIVRRGFPAPPSYHLERLRSANDRHFFDVITEGFGLMYPYADRLTPADRWAVIAYIRALQLSQRVPATRLAAEDRAKLASVPQ